MCSKVLDNSKRSIYSFQPSTRSLLLTGLVFINCILVNCSSNNPSSQAVTDFIQQTPTEKAQKNLNTRQGADFNWRLGVYFDSQLDIYNAKQACIKNHNPPHIVDAYFYFDIARSYEMRLNSDNPFAQCIKKSYEGYSPLHPPWSPYFQVYEYKPERF